MPGLFDDIMDGLEEGNPGENPVSSKASQDIEEPYSPEPLLEEGTEFFQEESIDQQMSEAERRLSKALLYKQWASGPLFEGDSTELTREVEAEISGFVKERLGILLGCTPKPVESIKVEAQFTPVEAKFLKLLTAQALTQKPKLKAALEKNLGEQEVPKPTLAPKPLPVRPTIKPRQQPEVSRPVPQGKPQTRPQQAPARPQAKLVKGDILPQDNEIVTEGNKKFRVKWEPMSPDFYGNKVEQLLTDLPRGKHTRLPKPGQGAGMQIYKATDSDYFKVLRLDITPQTKNTQAVPMPISMEAATAMQAGAAVSMLSKGSQAIANVLSKKEQGENE
jgi:hypothetical protein